MAKKGATKTGGTAGRKRAADSAMAARLKEAGEKRTYQRCPINSSHLAPVGSGFDNHIRTCK